MKTFIPQTSSKETVEQEPSDVNTDAHTTSLSFILSSLSLSLSLCLPLYCSPSVYLSLSLSLSLLCVELAVLCPSQSSRVTHVNPSCLPLSLSLSLSVSHHTPASQPP